MAKVGGPCMSMTCSGTIADALTFATWKGIAYVRGYQKPSNPNTEKQINQRNAFKLIVKYWSAQSDPAKDSWDLFASGTGKSGFNQFVERALKAYKEDHGSSVAVTAVTVVDVVPVEIWTWTPAV